MSQNLAELDSMRTGDLQLVCDDATETREAIRSVKHRRPVAYINIGAEILAHRMVRRSNHVDELVEVLLAFVADSGLRDISRDDPRFAQARAAIAKTIGRS